MAEYKITLTDNEEKAFAWLRLDPRDGFATYIKTMVENVVQAQFEAAKGEVFQSATPAEQMELMAGFTAAVEAKRRGTVKKSVKVPKAVPQPPKEIVVEEVVEVPVPSPPITRVVTVQKPVPLPPEEVVVEEIEEVPVPSPPITRVVKVRKQVPLPPEEIIQEVVEEVPSISPVVAAPSMQPLMSQPVVDPPAPEPGMMARAWVWMKDKVGMS